MHNTLRDACLTKSPTFHICPRTDGKWKATISGLQAEEGIIRMSEFQESRMHRKRTRKKYSPNKWTTMRAYSETLTDTSTTMGDGRMDEQDRDNKTKAAIENAYVKNARPFCHRTKHLGGLPSKLKGRPCPSWSAHVSFQWFQKKMHCNTQHIIDAGVHKFIFCCVQEGFQMAERNRHVWQNNSPRFIGRTPARYDQVYAHASLLNVTKKKWTVKGN